MSPTSPRSTSRLLASLALAAMAVSAHAQTLYGIDSQGGLGNPLAVEITGGPGTAPCPYPNGPFGAPAFAAAAVVCPGPVPFGSGWPGIDGDIAVDHITDTVFVADHATVGAYDVNGVQLGGFGSPLPGTITGLGCDSAAGRVWISNGTSYARVIPGCAPVAAIDAGPFPNTVASAITDLSWDVHAGGLWMSYANGRVSFVPVGGAPACSMDTTLLGLVPPLTGLDVDTTTPGFGSASKTLFATNGTEIVRLDVTASCGAAVPALAAPSFAFPSSHFLVPLGPLSGLAFAAHGATFGAGSGPDIRYHGNAVVGTTHALDLAGAAPGNAGLFVDFAALCPALPFKGLKLYVLPTLVVGPIAHGGSVSVPVTLPPGSPVGIELFLQWFNKTAGGWESTPAMVLTSSRP